jgi:hypothetical protein
MVGLVPAIHVDRPHRHFAYSWRPFGKPLGRVQAEPPASTRHSVAGLRRQSYHFRAAAGGRGGGTVDCSHGDSRVNQKFPSFDQAEPTPSATAPPAAAGLFNRRLSGVCSVESRSRFSRRLKCLSGEKTKFTLRNRDILLYPCVNGAPRGDGQKYRDGSSRDQFLVNDVVRERRWNSRNKATQGLLEVGQINTFWSG